MVMLVVALIGLLAAVALLAIAVSAVKYMLVTIAGFALSVVAGMIYVSGAAAVAVFFVTANWWGNENFMFSILAGIVVATVSMYVFGKTILESIYDFKMRLLARKKG